MSRAYISPTLRRAVSERARLHCCYCQTSQHIVGSEFTIDHIIPESLGGVTLLENLCLAGWSCNLYKQDRVTAFDPDTGEVVRLFHPFRQQWQDHFAWFENGLLIMGITPTGRTTVNALRLNRLALVNSRRLWISAGWHPPLE